MNFVEKKRMAGSTLKRILLLGVAVSLLFAMSNLVIKSYILKDLTILVGNINQVSGEEQVTQVHERVVFGSPVRLRIPSINVDAPVELVGLTTEGAMDVPKERGNVAWFNLGPKPGENGSAVLAGHYGLADKKPSVFDDLHKLRKGDYIYIEDDKGSNVPFIVRESRRYDSESASTDTAYIFGSNDGKPHLNLITCEGFWDKSTDQYSKRLVVFTDKVTDEKI